MKSLIENYYAAFNSGDREALLELLAEDVVHEVNEGLAETGKEAFRAFLERMDRCYRETVEELEIFTGPENRAAAEFYIRGEYLATDTGLPEAKGQAYRLRVGAFFDARLGKITRVTNYYNLRTWLAQVS
ncbi:nuclear transport factor 2 family protein [Luteolibacter arcticus]|uniref:Nuclear transport factor 2 family protein n=1 Tax=Luteolibacter arcticus TaxID=1581411 RepID=A0ABT3GEF3_9BACT|nr:ketosteroid isomerase-related protein [Luteolibacter arcticus]MCW1921998.1 nuclear transport factor 2 family protein [Luteolibacter arcticus]